MIKHNQKQTKNKKFWMFGSEKYYCPLIYMLQSYMQHFFLMNCVFLFFIFFLCRVREAAKKGGPGHCLYTQTQPPQVPTPPQLISPLAQDICFALISISKLIEIFLHGLIPWFSQWPPLDLPSLSGSATTKIHIFFGGFL